MPLIEVLCNANAGRHRGFMPLLKQLKQDWKGAMQCNSTSTLEELARTCEEVAKRKPDAIAIAGGDGTISRTLTRLMQPYQGQLPRIMLIPSGTMNYLGNYLQTDMALLERYLRAHGELATKKMNCIRVNDNYGFLFGAGFITRLLQRYETRKKNLLNAIMTTLSLIGESVITASNAFTPTGAAISLQGKRHFEQLNVAFAGTYGRISFGIEVFPALQPGTFGYLIDNASPFRMLAETAKMFVGKTPAVKHYGAASTLALSFPEPTDYTIDGELYKAEHLTIQTGPTIDFITG